MRDNRNARLFMISVGFSVDLILRSLLRHGIKDGDTIVLIYTVSGEEKEVKRALRTVEDLENILGGLKSAIKLEKLEVSAKNFEEDVYRVYSYLVSKERKVDEVVAVLSGGMRLLMLEVLTALALHQKYRGDKLEYIISLMREDGLYYLSLPLRLITDYSISPSEKTLLIKIGEMKQIERIKLLSLLRESMPRSTFYETLRNLEEKGLIREENNKIMLTFTGRVLVKVLKGI